MPAVLESLPINRSAVQLSFGSLPAAFTSVAAMPARRIHGVVLESRGLRINSRFQMIALASAVSVRVPNAMRRGVVCEAQEAAVEEPQHPSWCKAKSHREQRRVALHRNRQAKIRTATGDNFGSTSITLFNHLPQVVPAVTDATWKSLVLEADLPVLVEFWAPWCGPCCMIHPVIDELSKQFAGKLKCFKLNTDESPSIASQYGIRSIPTAIIFKNGDKKDTIIGAVPKSALISSVERFL